MVSSAHSIRPCARRFKRPVGGRGRTRGPRRGVVMRHWCVSAAGHRATFRPNGVWRGIFIASWRKASNMRGVSVPLLVAAATTIVLAAPKFRDVWKSPEVSHLNFAGKKVAALVITESQSLQMSGEEALARELTARGVVGTAQYRFVPREELKNADKAKGWFERAKVDGVVALRPISRTSEQEDVPVVWSSGYYPSFWGYYGYGWTSVTEIPTGRDTTTITVETLVY